MVKSMAFNPSSTSLADGSTLQSELGTIYDHYLSSVFNLKLKYFLGHVGVHETWSGYLTLVFFSSSFEPFVCV